MTNSESSLFDRGRTAVAFSPSLQGRRYLVRRKKPGAEESECGRDRRNRHLYRGEVYRSTIWRTRVDTATNWSVVTLGIALSISFASPEASPLPLVLVGVLIIFFLMLEVRRYRYFNVPNAVGWSPIFLRLCFMTATSILRKTGSRCSPRTIGGPIITSASFLSFLPRRR